MICVVVAAVVVFGAVVAAAVVAAAVVAAAVVNENQRGDGEREQNFPIRQIQNNFDPIFLFHSLLQQEKLF